MTDTPRPEPDDETRRDWEVIQENVATDDKTERLRIGSGWLYRTTVGGAVALVYVAAR